MTHNDTISYKRSSRNPIWLPEYIVACHLPRVPNYGGVRTWVEGSQMRGGPHTGWSLQPTGLQRKHQYGLNNNKITNKNIEYTPY